MNDFDGAFDEVAGISFKDKDGVQIMKDYMASGSFARGRDSVATSASMVFFGNIQSVDTLVKTSHLLAPFPEASVVVVDGSAGIISEGDTTVLSSGQVVMGGGGSTLNVVGRNTGAQVQFSTPGRP